MKIELRTIIVFVVFVLSVLGGYTRYGFVRTSAQTSAKTIDYLSDVQPILAEACYGCHGPNESARQANLRFDTDNFLTEVVVPGNPNASPLLQRLISDDTIGRMPPVSSGRTLTLNQIE